MKIQPVKEYRVPKYPDKSVVYRKPNLLKSMPERWKGNICVGVATSSLIMMIFTACGQNQSRNIQNSSTNINTVGQRDAVAPLFIHGDGRGSFGCSSIAPPVFLSEEEAFQTIQEESRKMGLELNKDKRTFENIGIPISDIYPIHSSEKEDGTKELLETKKGKLQLDGYNEKKFIGFEYISKDDFVSWHKQKNMMSSVESYDLIPAAETLRKGFEGNTDGNIIGVFYDPMASSESINKKFNDKFSVLSGNNKLTEEQQNSERQNLHQMWEMELKQANKEELRAQVKDFLNWLKAEGII